MASTQERASLQMAGSAPQSLASLANPPTRQVDSNMMDYFLIAVVETLRESAKVAVEREKAIEKEMRDAGLLPAEPPVPAKPPIESKRKEGSSIYDSGPSSARNSTASLSKLRIDVGADNGEKDEVEEALRQRLEGIGVHVGANFSERLTLNRSLFSTASSTSTSTDTLEAVKFICKDVWIAVWDKQVDNLRTNHRGVYVITDNQFKPVARVSSWEGRQEALRRAKIYTALPTGIIKGVLSRLGFSHISVNVELTSLPGCTFQIKLPTKA